MSESIRWAIAIFYMVTLWSLSAFLIYNQSPGWGWFLACVTLITSCTRIKIDSNNTKQDVINNDKGDNH